ncbi:RraA family protein [Alphaproteobacteria bacterium]|jgi:regulator of RNase E activity RraA|nr:RraA family protein [Alphaproteobacteria bacterium]MDA9816902.1 RraA family protein [Alphaproteobacteria bacterium]MDA9914312.1 RraA family protein [Alphaproteobacteria bacterium]MDB2387866.1 RraA family protein [Alphaproteobacteria bacterium]MDB3916565.1 RraA family protein [Alphaproteobacteria bacterium]
MIENPPLIQIKKKSSRKKPSQEQIDGFKNIPTGFICDALNGYAALDPSIKPLSIPGKKVKQIVGPALTVFSGAADVLGMAIALSEIQPGDIVVNGVSGFQGTAAVGDRIAGMIKNNGGIGLVTDGPMRDLDGIIETGLDCFCTGLNPNSPFNSGPAKIGFPINIGGTTVSSGDIIVADSDGVTVVPFDKIDEVLKKLDRIIEVESAMDKQVSEGLKISQKALDYLKSDQVVYFD